MRSAIFTAFALLTASLAAAGASAAPGGGGATATPEAVVRVVECARGPEPQDRHATFRAVMRRLPGTARMSMRFALQERIGDGRFRRVNAPGLGGWHESHPAVRRFAYRQRVLELAEGSAYRAVVSFRWHDGEGSLIRRVRRRSKPCPQSGLLSTRVRSR